MTMKTNSPSPCERYSCPHANTCEQGQACYAFARFVTSGITRDDLKRIPCEVIYDMLYIDDVEHFTVASAAQHIRDVISDTAQSLDITPCELEAEILRQSLMSDDCDTCHVNWLDLHARLGEALQS